MSHRYDPQAIEPRWQAAWEERKAFRTPTALAELRQKPKFYVLDMFPYPSGAGLHVGHPEGYTATDVVARLKRAQGFHVLHPMGWDAFGLPAERAALRENLHPAVITERNVENFRRQIKRLGFSYDWDRELSTSSPEYYRWTQWIFLRLWQRGLAYMAEVPVNWCPALGTVLANEEVKDGRYVETGDVVERRMMKQWMLRITAYAQRLLTDLEGLDWPEGVKEMQRNWIGRSEGAEVTFRLDTPGGGELTVFTTRPDTLFGCTYCVVAPEHPLLGALTSEGQRAQVEAYAVEAKNRSDLARTAEDKKKTGVFTGGHVINPANGQRVPVWVADYVLGSYGTGAIMAVPGHDERDHEFARAFGLPVVQVVAAPEVASVEEAAFVGEGTAVNSGFLDGLSTAQAKAAMIAHLTAQGAGALKVQYRLRDWLFSRQRYWGEPVPMVHLDDGTLVPLPDSKLPLTLPHVDEYRPTADGRPPLARAAEDWLRVTLPDGRQGTMEVNTMPQWAGSCWYYLRFIDPHNPAALVDPALEKYWMPVDLYVGGVEHAVLHLLYARFWHKVLFDEGVVSTPEPFAKLFNQGMILAYSYQEASGKYHHPDAIEERGGLPVVKATGVPVSKQIEKMSKSRFNVVSPDEVVAEYGADALRLYELFMGPLEQVKPWQMSGVAGVSRFLERVWRLVVDEETGQTAAKVSGAPAASEPELHRALHKLIAAVEHDTLALRFNTAISHLMTFANAATAARTLPGEILATFLRVLAPYAPHLAEELWHRLGQEGLVSGASWPAFDPALARDDTITYAVQVNGKLRAEVQVPAEAGQAEVEAAVHGDPRVVQALAGKTLKKTIFVPRRLVNLVVS